MHYAADHYRTDDSAVSAAQGSISPVEPLAPQSWFRALGKLAERVDGATSDQHETLLRHAYHLLLLTPRPLKSIVRSDLTEANYEQLLDCGAFEAAAVGLIGRPVTYAIRRREADLVEAQVCLPGQARPITARAAGLAMALLAAWTQCLVALEADAAPHPLETVES